MRYAFSAAVFFILCPFLALGAGAHAAPPGNEAAASTLRMASLSVNRAANRATDAARAVPGAVRARDSWIKLESGSRQVYLGIHGGTAPLSLMRSSDGALFAFTGQTGSDFTQLLRGGAPGRIAARQNGEGGSEPLPAPENALSPDKARAGSADLVFASSGMSPEGYQPFGFTPQESAAPEAPHPDDAAKAAVRGRPLKLRSYQHIINYSGSL